MEKKDHEFCLRCGRRLKNAQARELGYGMVCYRKQASESSSRLFDAKVKSSSALSSARFSSSSYPPSPDARP